MLVFLEILIFPGGAIDHSTRYCVCFAMWSRSYVHVCSTLSRNDAAISTTIELQVPQSPQARAQERRLTTSTQSDVLIIHRRRVGHRSFRTATCLPTLGPKKMYTSPGCRPPCILGMISQLGIIIPNYRTDRMFMPPNTRYFPFSFSLRTQTPKLTAGPRKRSALRSHATTFSLHEQLESKPTIHRLIDATFFQLY